MATPTVNVANPVEGNSAPVTDFKFINVFDQMAFLIRVVRLYLEGRSPGSTVPRYERITNINNLDDLPEGLAKAAAGGIKNVVTPIAQGTVYAVHRLIDLTLSAKDILRAADPLVAQIEAMLELVEQIVKENLPGKISDSIRMGGLITISGFESISLMDSTTQNVVKENFDKVKNLLNVVPSEEDLDLLGHELYRLACILYTGNTLDALNSGKVRILQFAFGAAWQTDINILNGIKELGETSPPSDLAKDEAKEILRTLGYSVSDAEEITGPLKQFQKVNNIEATGTLDNETLNRFFNLDMRRQNLIRAKRYVQAPDAWFGKVTGIINADADSPEPEPIARHQYPAYYVIKKTNSEDGIEMLAGKGWHAVDTSGYIQGFVGIQSRAVHGKNPGSIYHGETGSEGEAFSGKFFFAARHTEPWRAGRHSFPVDNIYTDDSLTKTGKISRMIQVVKFVPIVDNAVANKTLQFQAEAALRVLYNEKAIVGGKPSPDQGRIGLAVYTVVREPERLVKFKEAMCEWFPNADEVTNALSKKRSIDFRNGWVKKDTPIVAADFSGTSPSKADVYIKIILEGMHNANWDIDAYFDDVRVEWRYV